MVTKKLCLSAKWEQLSLAITHPLLSPFMNVYKVLGDLCMRSVTYEPLVIKCFIMYLFKPMLTVTSGKLQSMSQKGRNNWKEMTVWVKCVKSKIKPV